MNERKIVSYSKESKKVGAARRMTEKELFEYATFDSHFNLDQWAYITGESWKRIKELDNKIIEMEREIYSILLSPNVSLNPLKKSDIKKIESKISREGGFNG